MATIAPHQPAELAPKHWTEGNPKNDDLAHIPGEGGLPVIGNTFKMLADPHEFTRRMVETYGPVGRFGYGELVPGFTAEKFDADAWAELYQAAGARFAAQAEAGLEVALPPSGAPIAAFALEVSGASLAP